MKYQEQGLIFDCAGDSLVGVVAVPERPQETGVLIIVGGPQYRVGSHRQFVLIARYLAQQGIASMRFDNRSMGDATGEERDFEDIDDDLAAAMDTFVGAVPQLRNVVLWGLCGGASAACVYAPRDERVRGLILLNPWFRTTASQAKTYLKHYYTGRLRDPGFWKKLVKGKVGVTSALAGFLDTLRNARSTRSAEVGEAQGKHLSFLDRMMHGLSTSECECIVVLSGRDYVARECDEVLIPHPEFTALVTLGRASVRRIAEADHTFTSREMHKLLEGITVEYVMCLQKKLSITNGFQRELAYANDYAK